MVTMEEAGMEKGHVSSSASLRVVPPAPLLHPIFGPAAYTDAVPGTIRFRVEETASIPSSPKPHLPKAAAAPTPGNGCQPTSKA